MSQRVAIVTTIRNAGAVLQSFLHYHLSTGFEHIFLFFDDPHDDSIREVENHPRISVIRHDEELRRKWRMTRAYAKFEYLRRYVDLEVMARQALNVGVAIELALEKQFDWLLHIDVDELFYSPDKSVRDHFQTLSDANIRRAVYSNYEGVPQKTDVSDYFREVTIFKKNPKCLSGGVFDDRQKASIQSVPQLSEQFFLFYANGKCAAQISKDLLPAVGSHWFILPDEQKSISTFFSHRQLILHYPCCGFAHFWNKYTSLGRFQDKWFGTVDIAKNIGPFHLEARDIVAVGDREAAKEFYTRRVVINDEQVINRLIDDGLLARIVEPSIILNDAVSYRDFESQKASVRQFSV
jgi:hypothetical protein